jgi:carbonic anhydrase
MSYSDQLLARAVHEVSPTGAPEIPAAPALRTAIITCMDSRIDPARIFGLRPGEVHVIRNAGGVVTEDAIRSVVISQRLLGTQEVMVITHTDCGMTRVDATQLLTSLESETGLRPSWAPEGFIDPAAEALQGLRRLRTNPFLIHKDRLRAFVFDVRTTQLAEVS